MVHRAYAYKRIRSGRYVFISEGRRRIKKIVDFKPVTGNIVNLGFGDLSHGGIIDDKANSNNGDILKILVTVVEILRDYTARYPGVAIHFMGSTERRTRLYCRILTSYYHLFSEDFTLAGIISTPAGEKTIAFNPDAIEKYQAFLIKKKS